MTFEQLLTADYQHPTVAIFYGVACAPCERLKPKLREVCRDIGLRLEEFNTAGELEAVRKLGLRSVPGVYVVHRGEARLAFTGDLDKAQIKWKLALAGAEARY